MTIKHHAERKKQYSDFCVEKIYSKKIENDNFVKLNINDDFNELDIVKTQRKIKKLRGRL